MTLADLGQYEQSGPPSEDLGRTPPQDVAAEQSVLGGMMLSKDAIADVVEVLRGTDFYRPAHELVFDAVLDLYGRGEPADAVTVAAELTKRGELGRVGGAAYLHTLISSVPTAANAGYYAEIVRERAVLRRLVDAGTKIVQLGYAASGGDVDALVDSAQAEVYNVTERRTSEDYLALGDIIEGTIDEIEASSHRGDGLTGVPTGFADLDQLTNGLHPGQMIVIAARPALGKALSLDTPLPTPSGWTTMGEVRVGEQLLAADGTATTVVAATDVMHDRLCFEITFDDGTVVVADAQHQWLTETRASRRSPRTAAAVRTTEEIARTLTCAGRPRPNHSVPTSEALRLSPVELAVPPYTAGVALGTNGRPVEHPEVVMRAEGEGADIAQLPRPGGVPAAYLRGSECQRREVLAGLLDVAGQVESDGMVRLLLSGRRLARVVRELVNGLGYVCSPTGSAEVVFATADTVFGRTDLQADHKKAVAAGRRRVDRRFITAVRRIESVPVRCVEIDHPDHLYLATRSMIPTHNSTMGLDIARSAAIKHGMPSVIFSLEMGRNEITMRLLSAEATVSLQHMRKGTMREEDWTRLARTMGRVSEAPLFIDDSPNMSLMEIRAKCRRLKQQHGLKLVVIDYLQLMTSGKRVESRQQEVSEFSRALKLLAKELEVPVIAISQLNRGAEQRTDKRPAMSDLRESGCLTADTRLMRADTNTEVTLGELLASGARDVPVWSLNERLQLVPRTMTHVFPSGVKEVYRLRLASGREISATANHPFLTYDGWRPLGELEQGTRLAVARHVPPPLEITPWDEDEIVLLAHMIGDGSFVRRQPIRYASIDEANLSAVGDAASRRFGITGIRDEYPAARVTTLRLPAPYRLTHGKRNPIAAWLDDLSLFGLRSHEKFVPGGVFSTPKDQVALFLRHLWATDGCVHWHRGQQRGIVYYASTSRRLIDDVARLLLRFNIHARIKTTQKAGYRPGYQLHIMDVDNQRRFLQEIGVHGERGQTVQTVLARLVPVTGRARRDTVPTTVWDAVRQAMQKQEITTKQLALAGGWAGSSERVMARPVSRTRLSKVAEILGSADLEVMATNDIYWDEVTSVSTIGERPVFDATVMGTHNFVADGIATHNSIEQDADMVILLHREDAYERESPRAGEADFIVAKHRNGPTDTIVVAFQGHYSRFVDMANG